MKIYVALFFFALSSGQAASLVEKHPQKEFIRQALQRLVDDRGKDAENNSSLSDEVTEKIGSIGRKPGWPGRQILHPIPKRRDGADCALAPYGGLRLSTPWRALYFDTDVVSELQESDRWTNHILKSEADSLIHDCEIEGERVVIKKK